MNEAPLPHQRLRQYGPVLLSASELVLTAGASVLLDKVGLQLRSGELLGVIGPNGAGKSTLLKILAGVLPADSGELLLEQTAIATMAAQNRARRLAWLEQQPRVQWPLTAQQVVALGRLPHGDLRRRSGLQAIAAALEGTDTAALAARAFHTLSEGEKLRVNLARTLATQPRVLLADEPVAMLDPWHQLQVLELLQAQAHGGMGIIVVMHDLTLAARFCDHLLLLDHGRQVAYGTPLAVLTPHNLASVYRISASLAPDTLAVTIDARLTC